MQLVIWKYFFILNKKTEITQKSKELHKNKVVKSCHLWKRKEIQLTYLIKLDIK